MSLPPPPSRDKDITGPAWQKWFSLVKEIVSPVAAGGSALWSSISKAGSKLTDIETRNHSDLQNLNSETASHLTSTQLSGLTGGDKTILHKHDHALQLNLNSTNYTHLTAANHADLTGGGSTMLHTHAISYPIFFQEDQEEQLFIPPPNTYDFDHVTFPASHSIGLIDHIYTLSELMDHEWSAGVVNGCALTDNGDGTISIASGLAVIRAVADGHTTLYGAKIAAQANISLTNDSINYVYLDYNAGNPQFAVSTLITSFNCMDKCIAYVVHRLGNALHYIDAKEQNVDANRKIRQLFLRRFRFSHDEVGSVIGSSGLALTLTAGSFNFMLEAIPHDAFDTSVAGTANVNVFALWTVTAGVWTETASSKVINTTLYNDLTTGPVTLGNNNFGVSWVYVMHDTPSELHVVMGQAEYLTLASARVASPPATLPSIVSGLGSLVGFVVYEKSNTVFNNVYSSFSAAFTPAAATTHNGLSGLQGGTIGEYYHLTSNQALKVTEFINRGGIGIPGSDGADGEDGVSITGQQGIQGISGTNGTNGITGFDGIDGEDGLTIPGPQGVAGPTWSTMTPSAIMAYAACHG